MPLLYPHLAKYTLCLSPTPEKSNMAPTWSGLSWQTKRSHCMHNLLVGRGEGASMCFSWNTTTQGRWFHRSPELHS